GGAHRLPGLHRRPEGEAPRSLEDPMIRLGVLGAGGHSRATHGPALRHLKRRDPGRVELAAVCDLDRDKASAYAAEFGFARAYADVEAMLAAERLDGLVAVTPLKLTERIASAL